MVIKQNEVQTQDFNLKKRCQASLHPSSIKKVKLSENESHSKITNKVIGNNDDTESKLDLQDQNISSQTSFWIPALGLLIADKHLILSSETLPDIIMLNDLIVPYSVEGHNYFIQEIRARSSQYLPCYKKSSGKFLQILKLYNYHWVAVTNFDLGLSDKPDQKRNQAIVYILDPYIKASYRHKSQEVKYHLSLIQDVCDILPSLNEKIIFIVMNIDQAPKRQYAGYYTVLLCYLILKDKDVFSKTINRMFLKDHLIEFLEYSSFSQYVFDYKVVDKCQTTYAVFVEKLYCTCKQPNIGERMKQCDDCNNWFHQHCEKFEIPPNPSYNSSNWFCRACQKLPAMLINSLSHIVLDKIFFEVCLADERMFAVIALVCKKWSLFINEIFVERVHYAWLDREHDALSW